MTVYELCDAVRAPVELAAHCPGKEKKSKQKQIIILLLLPVVIFIVSARFL